MLEKQKQVTLPVAISQMTSKMLSWQQNEKKGNAAQNRLMNEVDTPHLD